MPVAKAVVNNERESDALRRHNVMYERRLRELARIAPVEESPEDPMAIIDHTLNDASSCPVPVRI